MIETIILIVGAVAFSVWVVVVGEQQDTLKRRLDDLERRR